MSRADVFGYLAALMVFVAFWMKTGMICLISRNRTI